MSVKRKQNSLRACLHLLLGDVSARSKNLKGPKTYFLNQLPSVHEHKHFCLSFNRFWLFHRWFSVVCVRSSHWFLPCGAQLERGDITHFCAPIRVYQRFIKNLMTVGRFFVYAASAVKQIKLHPQSPDEAELLFSL